MVNKKEQRNDTKKNINKELKRRRKKHKKEQPFWIARNDFRKGNYCENLIHIKELQFKKSFHWYLPTDFGTIYEFYIFSLYYSQISAYNINWELPLFICHVPSGCKWSWSSTIYPICFTRYNSSLSLFLDPFTQAFKVVFSFFSWFSLSWMFNSLCLLSSLFVWIISIAHFCKWIVNDFRVIFLIVTFLFSVSCLI